MSTRENIRLIPRTPFENSFDPDQLASVFHSNDEYSKTYVKWLVSKD